jgi:23S rRNA pseudouridine2605 synthase
LVSWAWYLAPLNAALFILKCSAGFHASPSAFSHANSALNSLSSTVRPSNKTRPSSTAASKRIGLARALSKLGFCSRSQAFHLIRQGKVTLNGARPTNPSTPVRLDVDRIQVEGHRIAAAEKLYLLLNKPRGVITTASDEKGRDTVYSLLPKHLQWLAPVGRLDKASEGLLVLTNDSEWAARITDPATHLDKTYHVQINVLAGQPLIDSLLRGIETAKGETLRAKSVSLLRTGEKNSWVELVLDEGKNRQIRRMFDARGIEVLRLIRIAIGPLQLGALPKGEHRPLHLDEKARLDNIL